MILTIKLIFLGYKLKKEKLEIRAKKLSEYLNDTENYRKNGDKRLEAVSEFSNLATEITSCYFINFFPYVCILNHYLFFDKYSA